MIPGNEFYKSLEVIKEKAKNSLCTMHGKDATAAAAAAAYSPVYSDTPQLNWTSS